MTLYPSLLELFGESAIDNPQFIEIPMAVLQNVGLNIYLNDFAAIIAAIHELIKRTYIGWIYDNSGVILEDGNNRIIFDYADNYSDVKVIRIGKRWSPPHTIFAFFWLIINSQVPSIDLTADLLIINSNYVRISKEALGNPTTIKGFLHGFIHYLYLLNHPRIKVDSNYFVEILTDLNQEFNINEVVWIDQ